MHEGGEVVLITGAGSGLGLETALTLAARGYRVYGSVLTPEEAADLRKHAERRGVNLEILLMDVTSEPQVRDGVAVVLARAGRIDALVCFAGLGLRGGGELARVNAETAGNSRHDSKKFQSNAHHRCALGAERRGADSRHPRCSRQGSVRTRQSARLTHI